jgi:hypothetical protein
MVFPGLTSATIAGIVEALALKEDGEDPMNVAVHREVTTGSEFVFTMLLMHDVECDFEKITSTYRRARMVVTNQPRTSSRMHVRCPPASRSS